MFSKRGGQILSDKYIRARAVNYFQPKCTLLYLYNIRDFELHIIRTNLSHFSPQIIDS